ncbi:YpbF family protein [Mesobacillus maritimus]|uniref:YpbF family protein n=1 Tax=Mesobacillus maritimus TaxID=1643336 RepID=UPI00203F4CA6|nr:YpbF family protein [Mesobacillus maritimus]MCM3586474.1 YpbF family protein [Mesobacillus maritimus]MCM3669494.1 YpbF family protein [Mesobacillus maritimus]
MEETIIHLDERTDEATKHMLNNVVKRKRKYDNLKQKHLIIMIITVGVATIFTLYLYQTTIRPYSYSFYEVFSAFFSQSINLYLFILTGGLFGLMNLLREKRDKAEKEFHALRCEIIDKSKDLWKKEHEWKSRHLVFEMMKEKYDINLYHENK